MNQTFFCQLSAAQENLKHIFTVPESVKRTKDCIAEGKLLQALLFLGDIDLAKNVCGL